MDKLKTKNLLLEQSLIVRPFDFCRQTDPSHLLNFLSTEHSQTIALILSFLEPIKASMILSALNAERQSAIIERIGWLDRVHPEIITIIEQSTSHQLEKLAIEDYTSAGGIEASADILQYVNRESEQNILENLGKKAPELTHEIRKRIFLFEDLVFLDSDIVEEIMKHVEQDDMAIALAGSSRKVQKQILQQLSKELAIYCRRVIKSLKNLSIRETQEAQQRITTVARRLLER